MDNGTGGVRRGEFERVMQGEVLWVKIGWGFERTLWCIASASAAHHAAVKSNLQITCLPWGKGLAEASLLDSIWGIQPLQHPSQAASMTKVPSPANHGLPCPSDSRGKGRRRGVLFREPRAWHASLEKWDRDLFASCPSYPPVSTI